MTDRVLEGKTVLMTGAGRGMGRSMSIALAAAGAKVAMIDIDEDVLQEAAKEAEAAGGQGSIKPLICDVTDADRAKETAEEIVSSFGSLDVLINDAVVGPERIKDFFVRPAKFWDLDNNLWNAMLRVNIFGPQLMAKTCAPYMMDKGWGRIINVTTSLDTMYLSGAGAYGPTKAALEAHTRIMAQDMDGTGVTANILIPGGPVNTRMIPEASGIAREALIQPNVMQKPVTWLASEDSDGVTAMRFIAALWDESLDRKARIEKAGAPAAWTQIPSVALYPDN
ncbi:MAG: SDR family oxidoreductase [Pseudomonadota bacterium]|nr:SDR family oxidoreductase [Pseudomonadota bacterium]